MKLFLAPFAALLACTGLGRAEALPDRVVLPAEVVPERYDIEVTPNAKALLFAGSVKITIRVQKTTDRIVLNAADLTIGRVTLSGRTASPKLERDETQQTAAFVFQEPVVPGRYVLSIDYTGKIYQQASGLFAFDYDTPEGKRRALFTQLQNSDARRFVPAWDEPGRKAVFALTVLAPQGEMAVSNMPIAQTIAESDGRKAVRFSDSPKMSSYLLFLALGDFERRTKRVGATELGLVVRYGELAKGEFALDAAVKLLAYYNDYFGTDYPLPKLDLVAAPGQSQFFSAMENWGAIRYSEDFLLLDENSTDEDKQNVFVTVAHEVAHQWFGNLVTMAWWDDLWLNEGFASWMENRATDHFHPEWKIWLRAAADRQTAMNLDARAGTHPVITPIRDVFEAADAFDDITYLKGEAVVRMLEAFVGAEAFRAGVSAYIKKYAYGNAVTDELWTAIDETSPLPVLEIAHDFTLQAGVPLIQAKEAPEGVVLSQGRFAVDETSQTMQSWHTPVTVVTLGGAAPWHGIVSADAPAQVPTPSADAVIVNAGQTGYFRVAYDKALWAALAPRFATLPPEDQLGLLYDSIALGKAGLVAMSSFLELADHAEINAEPVVSDALADQFSSIDYYYEGLPGQSSYRAFARARLNPVLARLGWEAHAGEPDNEAVLRATILTTLGELDDAVVIAEARRRFAAFLADPRTLSGSSRHTVLTIVAGHADLQTWKQIHNLARAATDPKDISRLYAFLGASHDPALADRALALALSDKPPISVRPEIIKSVSEVFPERAFEFVSGNRVAIETVLEPASRYSFIAQVAFGARDVATAEKLAAYADAYVPETGRGEVTKAIAAIRYRAKVIATRLPDIDRWIAARGRSAPQ